MNTPSNTKAQVKRGLFRTGWLFTLPVALCLLSAGRLQAQTTTTAGGTGGGTGGGTAGGTGGGVGYGGTATGGMGGNNSATSFISNYLGPATNMAPSMTIGGSAGGGGAGAGRGAAGAATTSIPTTYNTFQPFYGNVLQPGLGSNSISTLGPSTTSSATGGFGQPLFTVLTSTSATGTASTALGQSQGGAGFTTMGIKRAPAYITALSDDFVMPERSSAKLKQELQDVLQRSSALKGKGEFQLLVKDAKVVVLRGQVATARDRRLAEGLIRLTPGVQNVINELQVTSLRTP
jgi:hypothetical protein